MGNDLKEKILEQNGIILDSSKVKKSTVIDCPRCQLINQLENKYCSKCSYPLKSEAYDEIKNRKNMLTDTILFKYNSMRSKINNLF
jgi:integrase/recombinase XerD